MRIRSIPISGLAVVFMLIWAAVPTASLADQVKRITKEELKSRLGDPMLKIIDVRYEPNWKKSGQKIKGAVREDSTDIRSWIGKYRKDQMIVFYCD